jgi:hypothetical protein
VPQLSEDFLRKMQQQAKNAKAGSHPAQVDHRLAEDPYLSRYGKEEGERQLIEDVRTKGAVCVTELITALFGSAEMFYRKLGETHPSNDPDRYNDWWVYHDALAQMTDEKCREWMEERGWYCRWIVPLFGLNDKVYGKSKKGQWTFSTAYKCRPVGDTPELVDLDCHLNKDARDCTEFHSAITTDLPTGDALKFDLSSYFKQRNALLRLVHVECDCDEKVCICGALPPRRIAQDKAKCLGPNVLAVHNAHGTVVDGLGNRNGNRKTAAVWELKSKNWGGSRPTRKQRLEQIKKTGIGKCWIHHDARAEWNKTAGIEEDEEAVDDDDSVAGCGRCLHKSLCMCSFCLVTPGCLGTRSVPASSSSSSSNAPTLAAAPVPVPVVVAAAAAAAVAE